MSQPRQVIRYNVEGLFVGPAPATGFHFITNNGVLNDGASGSNNNLLFQLDRVQSFQYSFQASPTEVKQIGRQGYVARPMINSATVNFTFDYLVNGIKNDLRLGLFANYEVSGAPLFSSRICILSGFNTKTLETNPIVGNWPYNYRDCRNIFLAFEENQDDLNLESVSPNSSTARAKITGSQGVSFGNCYLTNYKTTAAVGSLPRTTVEFTAYNMFYSVSGSGNYIPALDSKTRLPITGRHYVLPNLTEEPGISVVVPGDIQLLITNSGTQSIQHLGPSFTNYFSLQDYSLSFKLEREPLSAIGYKLPLTYAVNFPVMAEVTIGAVPSHFENGALIDMIREENQYDFSILFRTRVTGQDMSALRWDISGARCVSASYSSQIGSEARINFVFNVPIDPTNLNTGVFLSGMHWVTGQRYFY